MNTLKAIFLATVILAAGPVSADTKYRAGYEINFSDGRNSDGSIQTRSWLSVDDPVTHAFGNHIVSILLGDVSDSACSIIISVRESGGTVGDDALFRHSFDVSFNGVSEFTVEKSPFSIDGAFAVNKVEN